MKNQKRDSEHTNRNRKWQAHVKALAQSGLSRAEYCRRHDLSYHAMTYWLRRLAKAKNTPLPTLVPVTLPNPVGRLCATGSDQSELRLILPGKIAIAVGDNFSAGTLKKLLAVLESR